MPRNRGPRDRVFINLGTLKYGFMAGANSAPHRAALGHVAYVAQPGVFFGANAPKPPSATKEFATGSISSFCDDQKIVDLRTAGWTISRSGVRRGLRRAGKTRTVFVAMPGGYNYAWNITADDLDLAADLGFAEATPATNNLVWGSTPKPPRASRKTATGSREETFMEPVKATADAAAGAGWSIADKYSLIPAV